MPWMDTAEPANSAAQQWRTVFKHALLKRITAEQLVAPLKELARKHPAAGQEVANVLLGFRAGMRGADDPLLFRYAEHLLRASYLGTGDLLLALLKHSVFGDRSKKANAGNLRSSGLPTCEERMFTLVAQLHLNGTLSTGLADTHQTAHALVQWLHIVSESEYNKQLASAGLHTLDPFSYGMYDALGSLTMSIFGKHSFRAIAKQVWWKERRPAVVRAMVDFDLHVLHWMQSQLSGRLQALSRMPPFVETDPEGRPVVTGQQTLDSVADLPIVRTRAGLYVWLNACLSGRPLTDDMNMLGFLQARYPGDNQTLAVDLLTAAFDVLTNAMLRKEPRQSIKIIRSFICNKVPLLLSIMAAYLAPMTAEACVQMAFMQIAMDALPPITAGATDAREMLKRTRLEFLQACALHGLVSESTIGNIIQEPAMALPRIVRYSKDGLVSQCTTHVGRLEGLAEDLQSMQGNAGAVAGCIVELLNNHCMNKDTMSLKTVCTILIKRIPDMDVVMQYTSPAMMLAPLCSLLHDWVHDQDQTEFTPSYEEFASILLFTLAVVHRYEITIADIPLAGADNFVFQLLDNISSSTPPSNLSEEQSAQLTKWIEGLFATDEHGETSGISDDVMRQCPPQAFYSIVPALFEQSVLACRSNALSIVTFKGGLELLLEPFLLPSLVGGLSWLVKHSWEDNGDADLLLQVLDKLLKPSSSSQETQAMHRAILAMAATPLIRSLQDLLRKRPDLKKATNSLISLLMPYLGHRRTDRSSNAEVQEWAGTPDGGWARCVRNSVRDTVAWTSSIGLSPPTKYTHKMFIGACRSLGPAKVLAAMVAELKDQTAHGSGAQALDVCVAMITAPTVYLAQNDTMTVREHLRLLILDAPNLLKRPLADAEALVRLSRRAEAQLAAPQMAQMTLPMAVQEQSSDQIMHELGLTDANGAPEASVTLSMDPAGDLGQASTADFTTTDFDAAMSSSVNLTAAANQDLANLVSGSNPMQMDPNVFGDLNMGMSQPQQSMSLQGNGNMMADVSNVQTSQEEDIFADLMGDLGDDFSFT
ncbi:hypothetical protein LTR36_004992 [Oleoguttula mirabilis]|uniref:Mediator of RNA polymerase II transcription subunit 5 n=1 Tax=Oleoguttula mirabilis TaxID=1507867 RepID=A0AAV9JVR0_9PEZI|nr:hypothetical protein LTR36_004992 [Oleoguttula mirabilis]